MGGCRRNSWPAHCAGWHDRTGVDGLARHPVGAAYAGVEVHANLIAGLLDGTLKHEASLYSWR